MREFFTISYNILLNDKVEILEIYIACCSRDTNTGAILVNKDVSRELNGFNESTVVVVRENEIFSIPYDLKLGVFVNSTYVLCLVNILTLVVLETVINYGSFVRKTCFSATDNVVPLALIVVFLGCKLGRTPLTCGSGYAVSCEVNLEEGYLLVLVNDRAGAVLTVYVPNLNDKSGIRVLRSGFLMLETVSDLRGNGYLGCVCEINVVNECEVRIAADRSLISGIESILVLAFGLNDLPGFAFSGLKLDCAAAESCLSVLELCTFACDEEELCTLLEVCGNGVISAYRLCAANLNYELGAVPFDSDLRGSGISCARDSELLFALEYSDLAVCAKCDLNGLGAELDLEAACYSSLITAPGHQLFASRG